MNKKTKKRKGKKMDEKEGFFQLESEFKRKFCFNSREDLEKKLEEKPGEREKYDFLTKAITFHKIRADVFANSAAQTKEGYEKYRQSIEQARMIKEASENLYRNSFRRRRGILKIYHSLLEIDRSVTMNYARDVLLPAVCGEKGGKGKPNWDDELRKLVKER